VHETVFSAEYDAAERASYVERALRPEVGDIDGDRTSVALTRDERTLEVTVRATDLTALRAGLNTWLGLVGVAERTVDITKETGVRGEVGAAGDGPPE